MTIIESSQKVKIIDIAQAVGVSPATVSLALRNRPGVSTATRERVLKTATAMGYLYESATNGASHNVASIGVVVKDSRGEIFIDNPFYGRVIAGIEGFCRQENINLLYAHLSVDDDNNPLQPPRLLQEQAVDGLLFVGFWLNETAMQILQRQESPIVMVDAYAVNDYDYDSVRSDNTTGGFKATKHLLDLGHQRIALVGSMPHSYPSIQGRRRGYERALRKHGLQPYYVDCHMTAEEARTAVVCFLEKHPEVTAAFACNDEVAIAVLRGAQEMGRSVPEDLSVIGFDDINPARMVVPALTTMRIDKAKMGRTATQLLIDRIRQPQAGRVIAYLQPELVIRESTLALTSELQT